MKKIISTAVLGSALIATSAFAGISAGIQGGYGQSAGSVNNFVSDLPNATISKKGNGYYGVYLGFDTPIIPGLFNLGVGADYIYSNNFVSTDTGNSGNMQAIPVYVTGKLLLPLGLNAFAKAGYAYTSFNGLEANSGKYRPTLGAGIGLDVYMLEVFAQAQYFWRDSSSGFGLYGVGAGVNF